MFRSIKIVLICFFSNLSLAQDLNSDLNSIINKIDSANKFTIRVNIDMYKKKHGALFYKTNASKLKNDSSEITILGELEFIKTPNYSLQIDHEEKAILIQKSQDFIESDRKEKIKLDLKELKKILEEKPEKSKAVIELISGESGFRTYSIQGLEGLREVQVSLNLSDFSIKQLTYEYGSIDKPGQYIVLTYSDFSYRTYNSSHFKLSNYFTVSDGTYILNNKYKDYNLFSDL